MNGSPMRFAIAGCGNVAARHAACLVESGETELAAVYDALPDRARAFGARFGCEALESTELLTNRPDIEAVSVCVPSTAHAQVARPLLESGKHLLIEKPIDIDPGAARELVEMAARAGRTLSVVSQHRFHDDVRWLARAAREDRFGRIVTAHLRSFWSRDQDYYEKAPGRGLTEKREGGVLANQAVHALDLLLWILGPAESICGGLATLTHTIAVEDTATAILRWPGGALATVQTSTSVRPPLGESLEIRWEKATVVLEGGRVTKLETIEESDPPPSAAHGGTAVAPLDTTDKLECFRRQYHDFVGAVRRGVAPIVLPEEALHVIEVIQGVYAAWDSSGWRPLRRAGVVERR